MFYYLFLLLFSRNVRREYKFIWRPTSCLADAHVQPHALKPLINQTAPAVSWSLLSPWRASVLRLINTPEACPDSLLCTTIVGHWDALKGRSEMTKVYFTISTLCVPWGNTISFLHKNIFSNKQQYAVGLSGEKGDFKETVTCFTKIYVCVTPLIATLNCSIEVCISKMKYNQLFGQVNKNELDIFRVFIEYFDRRSKYIFRYIFTHKT